MKHDVRIISMAGDYSFTSSLDGHHDRWSDVDVSLYYEYTTVCCSIVCTIGNKELPEEVSARRKKIQFTHLIISIVYLYLSPALFSNLDSCISSSGWLVSVVKIVSSRVSFVLTHTKSSYNKSISSLH